MRRFRLFRVRSPLLTESMALSVPVLTEMFHFGTLASQVAPGYRDFHPDGFPHSDIRGSKPA